MRACMGVLVNVIVRVRIRVCVHACMYACIYAQVQESTCVRVSKNVLSLYAGMCCSYE